MKAQRLYEETVPLARSYLGPSNDLLPYFEINLESSRRRAGFLIMPGSELNEKQVDILKETKDGTKYIIQYKDKTGETKKAKVPPSKLWLANTMPVSMFGKIGKVVGYEHIVSVHLVEFEEGGDKNIVPVPWEALKLVFK